jgi:hypothetical protein
LPQERKEKRKTGEIRKKKGEEGKRRKENVKPMIIISDYMTTGNMEGKQY